MKLMQQEQRRRKKRRPFNLTAMIKVVQANLNHCRDAWDLLQQFVVEERVSVALLSDPYATRSPGWYADAAGLASVGVLSPGLTVGDLEVGVGFVSVTVGCDLRVYSCYAPPRWSDNEFEVFLGRLDGSVRSRATAATSTPGRCPGGAAAPTVEVSPSARLQIRLAWWWPIAGGSRRSTVAARGPSSTSRSPRRPPPPGCTTGR